MEKVNFKVVADTFYFVVGGLIYSAAVIVFLSPNGISPGGFTGIATVANHIVGISTGTVLFLLNIPVLILGYIKLGGLFILKTSFVTVLVSICLDVLGKFLLPLKTDGILASIFGGIIMGLGLSLILLRGATTGGVDIIAKLVNRKHRHFSVGRIILIADGVVIVLNALVYRNAESALYSVVAIYAATRIMDILLYGADKGKIIYTITNQPDIICREINITIGRGVTQLSVMGGYTGETRVMLMCTVRVHEVTAVYDIIKEYDRQAFVVITDAGEIIGEGFKDHNH